MPKKMIAYCGLVCSECPAFLATQAGDAAKIQEIATQWTQEYHADVRPEHVWCDGCLVEGKKCAHCAECKVRACAMGRGVANCAACPDYGCSIIAEFHAMVPAAKATLDALRRA